MTLPTSVASPRGERGLPFRKGCGSVLRAMRAAETRGSWFTATVRLADPSGWGCASFVTLRVNATVAPPATGLGVTLAAYGFVVVFADADVASEAHPARATRRASHKLPERPRRFVDMNPSIRGWPRPVSEACSNARFNGPASPPLSLAERRYA